MTDSYFYNNYGIDLYGEYNIYKQMNKKGIIGGAKPKYDENGNVIGIEAYDDDDYEKINDNNLSADLNDINQHSTLLDSINEYEKIKLKFTLGQLTNDELNNKTNEIINQINGDEKKDMFRLYTTTDNDAELTNYKKIIFDDMNKVNDDYYQYGVDLQNKWDKAITNLNNTNNIPINNNIIQDKVEYNKKIINEKIKKIRKDKIANSSNPSIIKTLNTDLIKLNNQLKYWNGEYDKMDKTQKIHQDKIKNYLSTDDIDYKLPKKYRYLNNDKINNLVDEVYKEFEKQVIDLPTDFITQAQYQKALIPTGGAKEFENQVEGNSLVKRNIYNVSGKKDFKYKEKDVNGKKVKIIDVSDFKNFQKVAGDNSNLPIDMIDKKNKTFIELKKYVNYDIKDLNDELLNNQYINFYNYIKNRLNILLSVIKDDDIEDGEKIESVKELNKYTELLNNNNKLDKDKVKKYIETNYGNVGIPIGVKKFGNIGIYNEDNEKKTNPLYYQKIINNSNQYWDIEIDYNENKADGTPNPNYGKLVKVYKKNANENYIKDNEGYDYLFLVSTKNQLLVFNYTDYIRKNKITSPLQSFDLGEDYYNKNENEKQSYFIPYEEFAIINRGKILKAAPTNPEKDEIFNKLMSISDKGELYQKYNVSALKQVINFKDNNNNPINIIEEQNKYKKLVKEKNEIDNEIKGILDDLNIDYTDNDFIRKLSLIKGADNKEIKNIYKQKVIDNLNIKEKINGIKNKLIK